MSVFISDRDTAKLYIKFFGPKWPQIENELIYIRDFEAVKKTCSRILSRVKTLGFKFLNPITHPCLFFKQYLISRKEISPLKINTPASLQA